MKYSFNIFETVVSGCSDGFQLLIPLKKIAKALRDFRINPDGLKETDLSDMVDRYGANKLIEPPSASFARFVWNASCDLTLRVLFACGLFSIIVGITTGDHPSTAWVEGAAIWFAVLTVILLTASTDYQKELQFRELSRVRDLKYVTVRRNGNLRLLQTSELVVGDIITLEVGDEIPADAVMINFDDSADISSDSALRVSSHNCVFVDESSLTGESRPVEKHALLINTKSLDSQLVEDEEEEENVSHIMSTPEDSNRIARLNLDTSILISGSILLDNHEILRQDAGASMREGKSKSSCVALVVCVGERSVLGKLKALMKVTPPPTPLQNKLAQVASKIGQIAIWMALVTLAVEIILFWSLNASSDSATKKKKGWLRMHVDFVILAITIITIGIPEGLPLAVTISLSFAIKNLFKCANFVKRLYACEVMGTVSEICTDKTGTLTTNRMTVDGLVGLDSSGVVRSLKDENGAILLDKFHTERDAWFSLVQDSIRSNTSAFYQKASTNLKVEEGKWVGSSTEVALVEFLGRSLLSFEDKDCQTHPKEYYEACLKVDAMCQANEQEIIERTDFSSSTKVMSTVVLRNDRFHFFLKGAFEKVILLCNSFLPIDAFDSAQTSPLTSEMRDSLMKSAQSMAKLQSMRLIAVAFASGDRHHVGAEVFKQNCHQMSSYSLTLVGIFGIRDPLRLEVPRSVLTCLNAGVNVRMVTGDSAETAEAIARDCGILPPLPAPLSDAQSVEAGCQETDDRVMIGTDFFAFVGGIVCRNCEAQAQDCRCSDKHHCLATPQNFEILMQRDIRVLARARPQDKYAMVLGLQQISKKVVAVTGDGANDCPALVAADVGFAMGLSGKETARMVADIVILDDDFSSIIDALKWGRSISSNIRKFMQFQLTLNSTAILLAIFCAVCFRESPLHAIQILYINLIVDAVIAILLATETPSCSILGHVKPSQRDDPIITYGMLFYILMHGFMQFGTCLLLTLSGHLWLPTAGVPDLIGDHLYNGRAYQWFSPREDYMNFIEERGYSEHYTFVFTFFFFLQIGNILNVKLYGASSTTSAEPQPFILDDLFLKQDESLTKHERMKKGFFDVMRWFSALSFICCLQILVVHFGGDVFHCARQGLSSQLWLVAAFGGVLCSLLWQIIVVLVWNNCGLLVFLQKSYCQSKQ
eukprot:GDKJ01029684.1.p1 GENE.GDKJ01029684.1~~GDKJ01029684.1.p1  ORF type:complete len:1161 (+),score=271.70 GDKJ01029684.1:72-3554(+)